MSVRTPLLALCFPLLSIFGAAQSNVFTYQGKLTDGASAPTGQYDFAFFLCPELTGGCLETAVIRSGVQVTAGVFKVDLDFGSGPFISTTGRFLEVQVKPGGSPSNYTRLEPRQAVTSSPMAIRALSAASSDALSGSCNLCVTDSNIDSLSGGKITGPVASAQNVSGVVQISNGGTGSSTQNFVDLSSTQIINGNKNFNSFLFVNNRVSIDDPGNGGLRVQTNGTGGTVASFGGNGAFNIDASGVIGGRFKVLESGNVGVGTNAPAGKLQVLTANDTAPGTIAAWDARHFVIGGPASTGGVGFSYDQTNQVGYIAALSPNVLWRDLVLQSGGGNVGIGTTTPTARLHVNGGIAVNGTVGLAGNSGQPGQVMTSSGSSNAAVWASPTNLLYQQTSMNTDTGFATPSGTPLTVPGLSRTLNVAGNAKLLIQFGVATFRESCAGCSPTSGYVELVIDQGVATRVLTGPVFPLMGGYVTGSWVHSVGPGQHSIEIRAYHENGSISFGGGCCSIRSNLVIQIIPE